MHDVSPLSPDQVQVFDFTTDRAYLHDGRIFGRQPLTAEKQEYREVSSDHWSRDHIGSLVGALLGSDEFPIIEDMSVFVSSDSAWNFSLPAKELERLSGVPVFMTKESLPQGCEHYSDAGGLLYREVCLPTPTPKGHEVEAAGLAMSHFVAQMKALKKWCGLQHIEVQIPYEIDFRRAPSLSVMKQYVRMRLVFGDDAKGHLNG